METSELQRVMKDNEAVVGVLSEYINQNPRFVTREMVEDLARDCGVDRDEAFRTLFVAACGLDTVDDRWHRHLEKRYFLPGVRRLDPAPYRADAYVQTIRFPVQKQGDWEMCERSYAPYEPFVRNDPDLLPDFCEIPQIGYFDEDFAFPAILENGVEWMTVTPNEVETMRAPIAAARGKVLTLGLGLGYFAFHASQKADVDSVTVVEKDPAVINLFRTYILPQFPHREKVRVVKADAFSYMETVMPRERFDFVFSDIWHDASDGLDMYLRLRKCERLSPTSRFAYWIEPSLLSLLRRMLFRRITDSSAPLNLHGVPLQTVLSNPFLKTLNF